MNNGLNKEQNLLVEKINEITELCEKAGFNAIMLFDIGNQKVEALAGSNIGLNELFKHCLFDANDDRSRFQWIATMAFNQENINQ